MNHDGIAAALLAADDYTYVGYFVRRLVPAKRREIWREVLTGTLPRKTESPVANALHAILNCVSGEPSQAQDERLKILLVQPFLMARSSANWFDWRYYFVEYPSMRKSEKGCYSPAGVEARMGYLVRRHPNLGWGNGDIDPYLDAVCERVGEEFASRLKRVQDEKVRSGQSLRLDGSGITLASLQDGWRIYLPDGQLADVKTQSVIAAFGLQRCVTDGALWHLPIAQAELRA